MNAQQHDRVTLEAADGLFATAVYLQDNNPRDDVPVSLIIENEVEGERAGNDLIELDARRAGQLIAAIARVAGLDSADPLADLLGEWLDAFDEFPANLSGALITRTMMALGRVTCPECHGCGGCGEHAHDLTSEGKPRPGWDNGCPHCDARGWIAAEASL